VAWLDSPQEEIRRAAFIVLSWCNDMRGLPYFLKAFQDDLLLEYAINGLLALGKKAVPEIVKAMKKPGKNKEYLKVLSMMGKDALLLQMMKMGKCVQRSRLQLDRQTPEVRSGSSAGPCEEVWAAVCYRKF
jgi:hypothetical protein